jgi:adenine phosphoribosyltransferase
MQNSPGVTGMASFDLDSVIRKIPGFPKPGILFYDITGILIHPEAFDYCIGKMLELYGAWSINAVAAVESRGFVFAAPFAHRRNLPLILLRKKGKLPGETYQVRFTLEYGEDILEVHKADVEKGMRILLIDDLIATGGTLKAAIDLFHMADAEVEGIFSVVGLPFLEYEKLLAGYDIKTLINYDGE